METETNVNGISYITITSTEEAVNPMEEALVGQLNHEFNNYRIYKNMSGICDMKSLLGSSSWFAKQAAEENEHFEKFHKYMLDRNMKPVLIYSEPQIFDTSLTLENLFMQTCELEHNTTLKLIELKKLAISECDYQTVDFLDWFLLEQVQEEDMVLDVLNRVRMSSTNLLVIDCELGQR
jgi:ferritin